MPDDTKAARPAPRSPLQDGDALLHLIASNAQDAITVHAQGGTILYANPAAARISGRGLHDLHGSDTFTLVHPADRERVQRETQELPLRGETIELEWRCVRPDGTTVWCESRLTPTHLPNGTPGHVMVTRDVTRRKRTEARQRVLELAVIHAHDAVMISDPSPGGGEPRVLYVNEAFTRITGYTAEEAMREGAALLQGADTDVERLQHAHAAVVRGENSSVTVRYYRKSGQPFWAEVNTSSVRHPQDDTRVLHVTTLHDVTERHLNARLEADRARVLETIARAAPLQQTLDRLTLMVERQVENAALVVMTERDGQLQYLSGPSVPTDFREFLRAGLDAGDAGASCGQAFAQRRLTVTADLTRDPTWRALQPPPSDLRACWSAPIGRPDGTPTGVVCLFRTESGEPTSRDVALMQAAAHLTLIAMERTRHVQDIAVTRDETLRTLGLALEYRDYETRGHTDRVVILTEALAIAIGLQDAEREPLRWGAYLHDTGKIAVPDQILLKPDTLSLQEWTVIEQHPYIGYELLHNIPTLPQTTLDVVLYHHEHWDGSGYPRGLAGEDIPFAARIFAVADVYDALTSDRPYKRAWTHEDALAELQRMAGTHLDPDVVRVFTRRFPTAPELPGQRD